MLKMTVRPLAIKNSNNPYTTPLSVDVTISSSTIPSSEVRVAFAPAPAGANDELRDA